MPNPWFRFYHDFANNPKVQMLSEVNQRRFVILLCLKCKYGAKALSDQSISFSMRISEEEWDKTKPVLLKANLIDEIGHPVGWDKYQYVSDTSKDRTRKYREKKKRHSDVTVTAPETEAETETETETERNKDKDKEAEVSPKKNKLIPYKKIIELYHECLPELAVVIKLTPKRKTQIRQRFTEDLGALENWKNFFAYVSESDFLMGRSHSNNGREPFRADFEWLTHSGNFTKVSEGKYHV